MKFDYDILFDFLPVEDKKSFMVWDYVFISQSNSIIANYRAPFQDEIIISLEEYQMKLKQKERDEKLKKIL